MLPLKPSSLIFLAKGSKESYSELHQHILIQLRDPAIYGSSEKCPCTCHTCGVTRTLLMMVNTPYVGSFADPGHKTALYAAKVSRVMKRSVKLPNLELLWTPRN